MADWKRWLLSLRDLIFDPPPGPPIEEARYPTDRMGRPDLTRFTKPVSHYTGYIEEYFTVLFSKAGPSAKSYAYRKYVLGEWGLIARGPAEALPSVLELLRNPIPEARQAATAVLDAWADSDSEVATHAIAAAERELTSDEPDVETLSILIELLGKSPSPEASAAKIRTETWLQERGLDGRYQ
jgi:hypothetical protein